MSEKVRAVVRRFSDELWGAGDMSVADEVIAAEVLNHDPLPGEPPGREGMKQDVALFRAAYPDLRITTEQILVESNMAALRWTAEGTHDGELMGIQPTGRQVRMSGMDILRVEDGQIVERWGQFDALGMIQQLGAGADG